MMVLRGLEVLFLVCLTSPPTSGISAEMAAGVIMELGRKFHAGEVHLLVSPEQETGDWWSHTVRRLTKDHIPTAVMTLQQAFVVPFRTERIPVHVIYSAGMKDTSALRQLTSLSGVHLAVWLLFLEGSQSLDEFFSDVHVPFNWRFLVAQPENDTVLLTEVYRVSATHTLTVNHYGVWTEGHPIRSRGNLYDGRRDLQGLRMRAVSFNSLPYSILEEENGSYKLGGLMEPIWHTMERILNFTTQYQLLEDTSSGSVAENGSWNGMIGMLARREADVAVTGTTMTSMRTEVVDFTLPIFFSSYRLFIRQPNTVDVDWGNFLQPFEPSLWLSILVVILVVSVLVEVCHQLSRHFGTCSAEQQYRPFFHDSLFHVFSAFCSQGHNMTDRPMSIRVLFLGAHMTTVVLLAAYSAGLISSLTVETKVLPFSTFEELLRVGTHMAGFVNNSAAMGMFNETKNPLLKELYTKVMASDPDNFPNTTLEGLQRVCSTKFAFIAQMSRVQSVRHDIPCNVADLPATSIKVNLAIAFAKNNPYRDIINHNLQGMLSAGLLQKLQPTEGIVGHQRATVKSNLESVNLGDAAPLLVVWGASVLVGVSLLVLERKARRILMERSYVTE